jgi:CRISPR-associated protein Cas1
VAWKGLHLSKPARLALNQSQISIRIDGEDESRLPLEDIAWIVLDTPQATLTTALLAACMNAGIAIVFTDQRHTPSGYALPFHGHYRQGEVARIQSGISQPLKKRLWQTIVRAKILNQASALTKAKRQGAATLREIARRVRSGDPDNVEARAARAYWSYLWTDFRREDEQDLRNKMLNYGYAVVRAGVARALVAYGLVPSLGLRHASATNAFNLADDLFEPFRPFVDVLARETSIVESRDPSDLKLEHRRTLAGALNVNCLMGGEVVTLLIAAERSAASLVRAMEASNATELVLPEFAV